MAIEIKTLTKELYSEYEEFILSYESSLFYHSTKYKDFLEDLLDCESKYLLAYENGQIQAVLPMMIKDGPYGKVINSLPYYGSNGGIIGTIDGAKMISSKLVEIVEDKNTASFTYIENPLNLVSQNLIFNSTDKRIGQFTDISCENSYEEHVMKIIDGNRRNEIRKAIKHGVTVKKDNQAVSFVKTVHQKEMSVLGRKYKSDRFFELIEKHFTPGEDFKIFTAEKDGEKIAALLMFYFNKTVEYFTPVVLSEARKFQPMSLIIFHSFLDAMKSGFSMFNWGGTWLTQDGVYRFKKQFGAEDFPYNYYTQVNKNKILSHKPSEILEMYPDFYVFNFGVNDK